MRSVLFVVLALVTLAFPVSALAVVDTTITITDKGGKPIPEGSVTLTREDKKPAPRPKTRTTDKTGKITLTHDENDKNDKSVVIVTVRKAGETLTTRTTMQDLLTGGTLVVESRETSQQQETRPTVTRRTVPARTTAERTMPTYEAAPAYHNPFSISLSGGPSWTQYSSKYSSTGVQAPFSGDAHATGGDLCGGVNGYWPIPGTVFEYGGGVNVCGDLTGKTTLFDIVRHGLTGHVTATIDPGARVEPYLGVHVAFADPNKTQGYLRMGPVFAYNKLTITSNQVPGGGVLEFASDTYWATGFGLQSGLSWPLCSNCVFGLPLSGAIGGKFAWYPGSNSVDVRSSIFGFTETATVDHVTQYSVIGTLSVPLGGP